MISLNNEITVWKDELSEKEITSLRRTFRYREDRYAIVIYIRNVDELARLGRMLTEMEERNYETKEDLLLQFQSCERFRR